MSAPPLARVRMALLRSRFLLFVIPVFALALGVATVHVPRDQEAVWIAGPGAGRRLEPGWHLRWPIVGRVARIPAGSFTCTGHDEEVTREGAARPRAWRVTARVRPEGIPDAARALDAARPCAAVEPLVRRALASGAVSSREAMRAALVDAGLEVREAWIGEPSHGDAPARNAGAGRDASRSPADAAVAAAAPRPAEGARPVLLVGLDGADWQILDPLIRAGLTPNLARLKSEGAWAALHSNTPMLSPLLWTTAATGKPPEEHGIVDFLIRDPRSGSRVPISSNFRRAKALWNILTDTGVSSSWVAWWASWPAERIAGQMVSDRVAYSLFGYEGGDADAVGATWPPSLLDEIRPLSVDAGAIGAADLRRFARVESAELERARQRASGAPARQAWSDPLLHLTRILASTATYHRTALHLMKQGPAALSAVYYQGIDEVGHRFGHCAAPRQSLCSDADFLRYRDTLSAFYRYQDEMVGELLERVTPGTVTLLLSDHGFLSGAERPADLPPDVEGRPGEWHRTYGIFVMHGKGVPAGRIDTVTLYDIAPTLLHLLGLPAGSDMRGEVLSAARQARPGATTRVASWEGIGHGAAPAGGAPDSAYDAEVIARLRSLGYIQGAEVDEEPGAATPQGRTEQEGRPRDLAPGGSVTYHSNLGVLYLNRNEPARAEVEFRRALELRASHRDAMEGLARALLAQGRAPEARDLLEASLPDAPAGGGRGWILYAAARLEEGRPAEGLAFLDRQERRAEPLCMRQLARSRLLRERDGPGSAEGPLLEALGAEPGCIDAVEDLFDLYEDTRQLARQDSLMEAALRARPDSPQLLGLESLRLKARGELRASERTLKRALELAPDDPMLLTNFGSLLGISGRLEEAARLLREVVRRFPHVLEARVNLGAALGKQGRAQEAIVVFEEARQLGEGEASPTLLNALALAYTQNNQRTEAIRTLERSLSLERNQPVVQAMLQELRRRS